MNLETKKGDKIYCSTLTAGYSSDQEHAEEHLVLNKEYTVERIVISNWSSEVFLIEKPGIPFNTVLFKNVDITFKIKTPIVSLMTIKNEEGKEVIKIMPDGDIFVNEKLIVKDIELVEGLSKFLKSQGYM
jgi:hypothetical protein